MIYFDNAATTAQKPKEVAEALYEAIHAGNLGNPARGSHDDAVNAFRALYQLREVAADFFGLANPLHVALTYNATDGLNRIIQGYFEAGDHVITSLNEHNSVLRPLYQMEKQGLELDFIGMDERGVLRYAEMEEKLKGNTKAVIITAASNVTGNGTDLEWVSRFCREHGLKFILDASQAAGVLDLDMTKFGIDVLCTTGHKSLYGPQGTGLICVKDDMKFKPVFAGGSGAHSFDHEHPSGLPDVFESGTVNTPGALGLTAGIKYVQRLGLKSVQGMLKSLESRFVAGLKNIPEVKIYGDLKLARRTACVGINIGDLPSATVAALLNEDYGIAVRPGAHCAPRLHEALGTKDQGIVRFSFSTFNTLAEVDRALEAIEGIAAQWKE